MKLIIGIFLETLLEPHALNGPVEFNQTRLALLKPYLHNSNYEVFIYVTKAYAKSKYNYLYFKLLEIGIKRESYFSSSQIINVFEKLMDDKFLEHKAYLKQKADQGETVIMIGAFTAQSTWIQEPNFSLVDWPNDSTATLDQLFSEQLLIQPDNIMHDKDAKLEATASNFFPVKQIAKRDIPFSCAKEIQTLIESIQILREDIKNLTRISLQLETEQLDLQKQMISAEKTQTNLINELLTHAPLTLVEIGITSIILALHVGEIICYFKKCYKKCRPSKTATPDSNIVLTNASTQTQANAAVYSSSSRESSPGILISDNDAATELKNLAKKKSRSAKHNRTDAVKFFNKSRYITLADNDTLYSEQASMNQGYQQSV